MIEKSGELRVRQEIADRIERATRRRLVARARASVRVRHSRNDLL